MFILYTQTQRMGQGPTQTDIQQQYQVIKLRDDGTALLQHKITSHQFLLRTVSSNIPEEMVLFEELLKKRQHVHSSHLLELVQIKRKQQKNVCSVVHKLYLLLQFPFKTLQDQITDKNCLTTPRPFLEAELWSILYSCSQGLMLLYSKKMPHESLTSSQIYISKDGIIKIADPILLGLQKNYIKILKNNQEHVHISPEIINFLDDCNFSYYDKEKSDVFILGLILLEASLLRNIQLFDIKTKKPYFDNVSSSLKNIRSKYSSSYCNLLQKMLQLQSKLRPTFEQVSNLIEHDANLYESTEEASSRELTISQKSKNQQNPPSQILRSEDTNFVSKNTSASKGDTPNNTIIRKLDTTQMRPYFVSSSPVMVFQQPAYPNGFHQLGHHTHSHGNAIRNGGPEVKNSPIESNQKPLPVPPFPNTTPVPPPQGPDINDRFSYSKFGNISLPQTQQFEQIKQKQPLFSYDIPQINQILKNTKFTSPYNSSFSKHPPTMTATTQPVSNTFYQQKINEAPLTNAFSFKKFNQDEQPKSSFITDLSFPLNNSVMGTLPSIQLPKVHTSQQQQPQSAQVLQNEPRDLNGEVDRENSSEKKNIFSVTEKTQENLVTSPFRTNQKNEQRVIVPSPQKSPGYVHAKSHSKLEQEQTTEGEKYVVLNLEGGGKYQGYLKNGLKNGEGRLDFNDGGYYVGEWKDNKMHGYGKLHYENGQVAYEGNWENDEFSGFGRVFNDRPEVMNGEFNYHDFAELGEKWIYYEGEFKSDSKHGKGKIRLTNGQVFEGNFIFDSIEGQGVFYTSKGEAKTGLWRDNMLQA